MAMKWDAGYAIAALDAEAKMKELATEWGDRLSATERQAIDIATSLDETEECMVR